MSGRRPHETIAFLCRTDRDGHGPGKEAQQDEDVKPAEDCEGLELAADRE